MIGADDPWPFVISEMTGAFLPDLPYIPHPVAHEPDDCKIKRGDNKNSNPTEHVLDQQRSLEHQLLLHNWLILIWL